MSKPFNSLLLGPPQHPPDSIQALIQICKRRAERDPNKVVARGVEQVTTVGRVDVEEDSWDHDSLFFEELFEEGLGA